ncbi:MAG: choice-of-anchor D domain-containing protein, partial [Acidobacteriota bacterium]|nr:choice-of-anchor D domain-containing protein [Acidobacteriota bacterium]
PLAPTFEVPVSLTVLGGPHLSLAGGEQVLESDVEFFEQGAVTRHVLTSAIPPGAGGVLQIGFEGDFSSSLENANLVVDGEDFGTVASIAVDCAFVTEQFEVGLDVLSAWTFDGEIEATLANTAAVQPLCPTNRHTVRLIYPGLYAPLDFPAVFAGGSFTLPLWIDNTGSETLQITSATTDDPAFVLSESSLTLEPGSSSEIAVSFHPSASGVVAGDLVFESNDPDQPVITIDVRGLGTEPPAARIDPPQIDSDLFSGDIVVRPLWVSNDGAADLDFTVSSAPVFARVQPTGGTLVPGATIELVVTLDASRLGTGLYYGAIEFATNDPSLPAVSIPVSLFVMDSPHLGIHGDPEVTESTL